MSYDENFEYAGFDDIPDSRPTIPVGEYPIRVVDAEKKQSQNTGFDYISYNGVVLAGPHVGTTIYGGIFSLKPKELWRLKKAIKAADIEIPGGLTVDEAAEYLVGQINQGNVEVMAKIGDKPAQVKNDETGQYMDDPDGGKVNTIRYWIGSANL